MKSTDYIITSRSGKPLGVNGYRFGEYLGIHAEHRDDGTVIFWVIDHLPTGAKIAQCDYKTHAVACVKALAKLGDLWNFATVQEGVDLAKCDPLANKLVLLTRHCNCHTSAELRKRLKELTTQIVAPTSQKVARSSEQGKANP